MKKYWISLIVLIIVGLLFIYKNSLYVSEKVYVIYKKDSNFYKNTFEEIFYYKNEGKTLQLASLDNKKIYQEKHQEINNLNVISIDSLSKILPLNFYKTHFN